MEIMVTEHNTICPGDVGMIELMKFEKRQVIDYFIVITGSQQDT